ncbi:vacuolar protein sorting-associated, partial [Protomyces lactucae-debilis]
MMQSSPLRIQPFAPTPYLPTQTPIARISLDEDVKLVTGGTGERDAYDTLAVIYGILVSLEFLERAYVRDAVTLEQYDAACLRLLSQYRTGLTTTPRVADAFENGLDGFMAKYRVSFPLAAARIRQGQPAGLLTESIQSAQQEEARAAELAAAEAEQKAAQLAEEKQRKEKQVKKAAMRSKKGSAAARVAETVQCFITLMDALKLSFRAKDQLHPLLADLMTSFDEEQEETIPDFPGKPKLVKWLIRTNQMKASEELSEEEVRDLFFEIESMYAE